MRCQLPRKSLIAAQVYRDPRTGRVTPYHGTKLKGQGCSHTCEHPQSSAKKGKTSDAM
jgi:hypothetical protein